MSIRINLPLCILTALYSAVSIRRLYSIEPSQHALILLSVTCEVEVLYPGAPGHQVQDAPVGHVPAPLELQPGEVGAVPGQQSQSSVSEPGRASQPHCEDTPRPPQWLLPLPPDQPGQDGPDGAVHVQPLVSQEDVGPEVRLPGQSGQPPAGGGETDQVGGGEEGEEAGEEEVRQAEEGGEGGEGDRTCWHLLQSVMSPLSVR